MVSGLSDVGIGDTIVDKDHPNPLPTIAIEEPTVRVAINERRGRGARVYCWRSW
jgi:predicted membrane GTPase involved in stress response